MQVPFAQQSYRSRSLPVSSQRLLNCYAEAQPPDAKSQQPIFTMSGLVNFATAGVGPCRGMWTLAGQLYVVSGANLYAVSSTGAATNVGGTITGTAPVMMSDNGLQLAIVNGQHGYIYTTSNGFQSITDGNFSPAQTVTFFDNYFVFDKAGTNQFFISASLDGTSYSTLDYASAQVNPDFVITTANQQENLLIFGQKTIETWYDAGAVNFPFQRYDGATIERGCGAPLSVVKQDNSIFFLGDDLIFYRLNGVIPVRISTHAIEYSWRQYRITSDCVAFTYTWEGHKFIVLNFPTGNATWVYDVATNLWHERESYTADAVPMGRWRGNAVCECYNKVLIGDAFSGQIGYLDDSTFTEFGNPLIAEMVTPVFHSDRKHVFVDKFELDFEAGVGVDNIAGDPQVMVDWSDDQGATYGDIQQWESMGRVGARLQRLRWTRLGQARQRVFRVRISDPVKRNVIACNADIRVGWN